VEFSFARVNITMSSVDSRLPPPVYFQDLEPGDILELLRISQETGLNFSIFWMVLEVKERLQNTWYVKILEMENNHISGLFGDGRSEVLTHCRLHKVKSSDQT